LRLYSNIFCFSEYSLEKELEIPKESFEQVQLTLILPSSLIAVQLPLRSKLIKSIYDHLKVSAVFLGEVACMAALGSAHGTALVLNFDSEGVEIAAVNDFSLVTSAIDYFSKPLDLHIELSKTIKVSNLKELFASFDLSNDLSKETEVKFNLDNRTVPLNIFHRAFEHFFVDERNSEGLNVLDVIETVIDRVDPDRRSITLNHLIINGVFPLPYPLLVSCLRSILVSSPLMAVSDYPADTQPTAMTFRTIPDYYIEIKETGRDSISWFGASLAGKYAHSDSKTFIISKSQQQQH
jgi:hypothetical protein